MMLSCIGRGKPHGAFTKGCGPLQGTGAAEGAVANMIRISTIFIAICMVLVAASLGLVLYSTTGLGALESATAALTALTFLILYNAVSMRLRDRSDVGGQIADLSRGTADLARQVAEFGRRLAVVEGRVVSASSTGADRVQGVQSEINELGLLVRQLATSVAGHEDILASLGNALATDAGLAMSPEAPPPAAAPKDEPASPSASAPVISSQGRSQAQILTAVKNAIEESRIDIYLQPMVTLPQRKVRFYEAMTRLRDDRDQVIAAEEFIGLAEGAGLIGRIDYLVLLRSVQVLRRLSVRNKEIGLFCNVAAATLANPTIFTQCLDFLEANRALAPSLVLEFKQSTFRALGPVETEHLAALAQRGYHFSIDHVTDLRFEPRELADRGVRFIKVPASLLLDPNQTALSDVHASDFSDLLGRFGIDLVAERIEGERAVVDLLDYDVRFGQGFLFSPPRPLRAEGASASSANKPQEMPAAPGPLAASEASRSTGSAALARAPMGLAK